MHRFLRELFHEYGNLLKLLSFLRKVWLQKWTTTDLFQCYPQCPSYFEMAVHKQLYHFLSKLKLLSPYQCGFRKTYSTENVLYLNTRIVQALSAFNSLNNIWRHSRIAVSTKLRIFEGGILPILLYGCQTWALKQRQLERLEAVQNSFLRRILRLRWFDFIPNKEIISRTGCLQLSQRLRILRLRYLGHVARMEPARLPSYLLNWKPTHGKRSAGRPRSTLLHLLDDDVKTVLGDHWDIPAACKLAVNRTDWRHLRNIHGEQADSGFLPSVT